MPDVERSSDDQRHGDDQMGEWEPVRYGPDVQRIATLVIRCSECGQRVAPARLSVAEGMFYCGGCNLYYGPGSVDPPQPETPHYGRPSERP
jgi:formylmethanofuran dehydrogenase subunit E